MSIRYKIKCEKIALGKHGLHPPQEFLGLWTKLAPYLYLVAAPCVTVSNSSLEERASPNI